MPDAFARSPRQLGHLIQRARRQQGLTQTELANLAGQRQEMISRIETGHGGVRISTICNVLAALGLEITVGPRSRSSAAELEDIF